jgi:hypothetical protein
VGLEGVLGHRVDRRVLVGGRGHRGHKVVRGRWDQPDRKGAPGHLVLVEGLGLVGGRGRLGPQDLLDR